MAVQSSDYGEADQRQAFRCPAVEPYTDALLAAGGAQWTVRVLDASATGFAVRASQLPDVREEDLVRIRTHVGWHDVRVAYITPERATATEAGKPRGGESGYRIGLERVKDVASRDDEGHPVGFCRAALGRSARLLIAALGMLVVAAIAGGVIAAAVLWSSRSATATRTSADNRPGNAPSTLDWLLQHPPSASPFKGRTPVKPSAATEHGAPSTGPNTADGATKALFDTIRRMPGPSPLLLSGVVRELGLDKAQQKRLRKIVELTEEVVREIDTEAPAENRQQQDLRRTALLEQARQQALKVLTPEQRARWDSWHRAGP